LVLVVFVLLQMPFSITQAAPPTASVKISPSGGTFTTDSTFDASILVDTGGASINAIEITLLFPADKLQVVSPSTGNSFVSLWLQPPSFSNRDGYVKFAGGVPGRGITTSEGLVSTITFRVKESGTATLRIDDKSNILAGDGSGTTVPLKSAGRAVYTLIQKAPAGPNVFSVTHPDPESWNRNNNIVMGWDREGEASLSYSYVLDQEPSGIPDNIDDTRETTASFPNVADGIWYFHIKQKRGGIYGEPSHYRVKIDTTGPADFKPIIEASGGTIKKSGQLTFFTSDALSGLDHYEIGIFDTSQEAGAAPIFVEATSPYRIPDIGTNVRVVIRAFDHAGNTRDGVAEFKSGNLIMSILKANYLGFVFAGLILLFVIRHIWLRHRAATVQRLSMMGRNGNFL
jgi:hypothetical protein